MVSNHLQKIQARALMAEHPGRLNFLRAKELVSVFGQAQQTYSAMAKDPSAQAFPLLSLLSAASHEPEIASLLNTVLLGAVRAKALEVQIWPATSDGTFVGSSGTVAEFRVSYYIGRMSHTVQKLDPERGLRLIAALRALSEDSTLPQGGLISMGERNCGQKDAAPVRMRTAIIDGSSSDRAYANVGLIYGSERIELSRANRAEIQRTAELMDRRRDLVIFGSGQSGKSTAAQAVIEELKLSALLVLNHREDPLGYCPVMGESFDAVAKAHPVELELIEQGSFELMVADEIFTDIPILEDQLELFGQRIIVVHGHDLADGRRRVDALMPRLRLNEPLFLQTIRGNSNEPGPGRSTYRLHE